MASRAQQEVSSFRQCGGVLSRLAYRHAERLGVNVDNLLTRAGLSKAVIEDRSAAIGVPDQIKFVELISRRGD